MRRIELLISIISTFYCSALSLTYKSEISYFFREIERLADAKGIPFAVAYLKSSRLAVTRYLSKHPLDAVENVKLSEG